MVSPTLAQDSAQSMSQGVVWICLALVLLALGGFVAVHYVRKWARSSDAPPAAGFTLADLRKLRQEGKISEEEFQLTSALVSKTQKAQILTPPPGKEGSKKPSR